MHTIRMREGVRLTKTVAGFIRGGDWNNGAFDGAFTLNLNNAPSNSNTNIGFRCSRYAFFLVWPEQKLYGVSSEPRKHTDALLLMVRRSWENNGPESVSYFLCTAAWYPRFMAQFSALAAREWVPYEKKYA